MPAYTVSTYKNLQLLMLHEQSNPSRQLSKKNGPGSTQPPSWCLVMLLKYIQTLTAGWNSPFYTGNT
jgi:hypothetical protein